MMWDGHYDEPPYGGSGARKKEKKMDFENRDWLNIYSILQQANNVIRENSYKDNGSRHFCGLSDEIENLLEKVAHLFEPKE